MNVKLTHNESSLSENKYSVKIAKTLTCVVSSLIVVENCPLLVFLCMLCVKRQSKIKSHGVVIHTLFVCLNDSPNGIVLLIVGVLKVDRLKSVSACAYTLLISLSLQIATQRNISFI